MEVEIKMESMINVASKCWLCPESAGSKARWSSVLDDKVAESVCSLLSLDEASYLDFFRGATYCGSCQETVLEIDILIRTVKSINSKILQYRTKLSSAFLVNLDISPAVGVDTIDINGDAFQCQEQELQDEYTTDVDIPDASPEEIFRNNVQIKSEQEYEQSPSPITTEDGPSELQSTAKLVDADVEPIQLQSPSPEQLFEPNLDTPNFEEVLPEIKSEPTSEPLPNQKQTGRITRSSYQKSSISYRQLVSGTESDSDAQSRNEDEDSDFAADSSDLEVVEPDGTTHNTVNAVSGSESAGGAAPSKNNFAKQTNQRMLKKYTSSNKSDSRGRVRGDKKAEILPVNSELVTQRRAWVLRQPKTATQSDLSDSEARTVRTRKRKLPEVTETETEDSSEDDSFEGESGSDSSTDRVKRNKNRTAKPFKKNGKGSDWRAKVDQLTIEINTTQRDGKFHCFHGKCTSSYLHLSWMKKHISTEHKTEPLQEGDSESTFRCRALSCSFTSDTILGLYDHFKKIHKPHQIVKESAPLQEDQRMRRDGRFHCFHDNCSKSYKVTKELRKHIFLWHTKRTPEEDAKLSRFPCREPDCSFFSRSSFALQVHMNKVHQSDPLPFKCIPCKKSFLRHNLLIVHNNKHHRRKELVCHLCGEQNARKSDLYRHMRNKHKNEEGFKCGICFQKFFFKDDCDTHEGKHIPGRPLTCLVMRCHKVFENQEAIRIHVVESHYEAQKFFCDKCGSSFRTKCRLRRHELSHTDLFEFPCTDCDKKFRSKQLQQSHFETVHAVDGGQVYPCKLCDKTFHCRIYLYKHNAWHKHGVNANKPLKLQKKVLESSEEDE